MNQDLSVRFGNELVGTIEADDRAGLRFAYAPTWLGREAAFPISLSLPLRAEAWVAEASAWFGNLLPEAGAREAVCGRLGLSVGNDYALLRAVGGECAGALRIVDPMAEIAPAGVVDEETPLDAGDFTALVAAGAAPLLLGGPSIRLSLAGAQNKLPVVVSGDDVGLPRGEAASTHLLKLPHARFKHLPMNEAFVMGLAERVGLHVAKVSVFKRTNPPSLLVERYDRHTAGPGIVVTRLHQEDLCQATGRPSSRKYEQEGGPSLAECIGVIARVVARPLVDVRRLIEWQAFNVIAGNSDGHGKNLSLLYGGGSVRLAPFYDLLSTRQYPPLDRNLAMSVGGERDPDRLQPKHWLALAKGAGLGGAVVLTTVREIAQRIAVTAPAWSTEFQALHGRVSILQTLPAAIRHRAEAVIRSLG